MAPAAWMINAKPYELVRVRESFPSNQIAQTQCSSAVGKKLGGLDLSDRGFHKLAKFQALLFSNGSPQVLDLGLMLSYENH
jgi:hypothetical protein